jgi:radical SAM superfamily enzyme YgiQ (UPF0313 family)
MPHSIIINVSTTLYAGRLPGAYRIAHVLRQNNWDVEVLDYFYFWSHSELQEFIKSRITSDTKFIGLSFLFLGWSPQLQEICTWIKDSYPHIQIISGSASNLKPSSLTNYRSDSNLIDYHVQGFGENGIVALLQYLYSNGPRPKFLIGRDKIIPANTFYPAYPMADLSIIYEDRDYILEDEWLGIEFSRGCKFSCTFCDFPIIGVKADHTRSTDSFLYQVRDAYDRFGVKNYTVSDETFNDSTEKITKYANAVEQLNFVPTFSGFIRADLVVARPHEKEELLRMNFLGQYYGLETFNHQSGKSVGKGMDPEKLKQGILDLKKYYLTTNRKVFRATISLILGLPHETVETLEHTRQWLVDNWQDQAFYHYVLGIPTGELDIKSKLSTEYSKFKYEEITQADTERYDPAVVKGYHEWEKFTRGSEVLRWKNENMTVFDAYLVNQEYEKTHKEFQFKPCNWMLSGLNFSGPVEDRINKFPDEAVAINKTKNYINKKLKG